MWPLRAWASWRRSKMAQNRFFQIALKWIHIDRYDRFRHPEHKIASFFSKIQQKIKKINMSNFRSLPTLISKASPIWPKSWKNRFFQIATKWVVIDSLSHSSNPEYKISSIWQKKLIRFAWRRSGSHVSFPWRLIFSIAFEKIPKLNNFYPEFIDLGEVSCQSIEI